MKQNIDALRPIRGEMFIVGIRLFDSSLRRSATAFAWSEEVPRPGFAPNGAEIFGTALGAINISLLWSENEFCFHLMSKHLKWTDRTFQFTFPVEIYPEMIERVRGTPARLEDRVKSIAPETLTKRDGDRWSIQENAGHLLDLESLFRQRLDEYQAGAEVLHAADMSNRKTYDADHNQVSMQTILTNYRAQRMELTSRLDMLPAATFAAVAHHPRLNVPMRLVDMLFFQAEHDDYHLARISELIRFFL